MIEDKNKEAEEERHTETLRKRFDVICEAANVRQGLGPPMACIDRLDGTDHPQRFVYVTFSLDGEKQKGDLVPLETLQRSAEIFRNWLVPNRTLLWRTKPVLEINVEGMWGVYWRCVQLNDSASQIHIAWNI